MKDISKNKIKELKKLAQYIAVMGVRNNTELESLHCGISPSSKTGDYTDVKVVTPYGEIMWNDLSRISDTEMRSLMLSVEKAIEMALYVYERLNREEKDVLLNNIYTQRSYDRHDWEATL